MVGFVFEDETEIYQMVLNIMTLELIFTGQYVNNLLQLIELLILSKDN